MSLKRCNKWMFQIVRCKGYLMTASERQHFEISEDGTSCVIHSDDGRDGSECEDGEEILKTYYIHADKNFTGIVVGTRMLTTKKTIYADWVDDGCHPARFQIRKKANEQIKCAHVYYGCNRSRWVPIDDMEVADEIR